MRKLTDQPSCTESEPRPVPAHSLRLLFLNFGHFADHMFMLTFAKAAFSAGLAFGLAADGAYAQSSKRRCR